MNPINLRVLIYLFVDKKNHRKLWIGQGLEYDIVVQGATIKQAEERFFNTLIAQSLVDLHWGKAPLEGIPKASRKYWNCFDKGRSLEMEQRHIKLSEYELVWSRPEGRKLSEVEGVSESPELVPAIQEARVFG